MWSSPALITEVPPNIPAPFVYSTGEVQHFSHVLKQFRSDFVVVARF